MGGAHYCFCAPKEESEDDEAEENAVPGQVSGPLQTPVARKKRGRGLPPVNPLRSARRLPKKKENRVWRDEVYGDIEIDYDDLDEGVLLKTDGFPTYNFANVIDDHLMEIHPCGAMSNEYISSTPKYNLIYETFG